MSVDLTIDHIGAGGDGIAFLDQQTIYLPATAPGEIIKAEIGEKRGNGFEGTVLEVITSSGLRQKPICRHYDQCGGCNLQHLQDGFVDDWKRQLIVAQLARQGLSDIIVNTTITSAARSRRRIDFVASRRKKSAMVGFHQKRSKQIFDIGDCPVIRPELLNLAKPLRNLCTRVLPRNSKADVIATLSDNGVDILITSEKSMELDLDLRQVLSDFAEHEDLARICWRSTGKGLVDVVSARKTPSLRMGDVDVALAPAGFLQATKDGETALANLVQTYLKDCHYIADLFAGCGSFTFPLAKHSKTHAVDSNPDLIQSLQSSANKAVAPVTSETRDLFQRPITREELKPFDGVLFDPPRAGAKIQVEEIAASSVKNVVGISCSPGTFARDARVLIDGGYSLIEVTPVDQFRWSSHVELIGLFKR